MPEKSDRIFKVILDVVDSEEWDMARFYHLPSNDWLLSVSNQFEGAQLKWMLEVLAQSLSWNMLQMALEQ